MRQFGGQLHVMGGQDDGVPLGGQPAQHAEQTGLRRVVQTAGRLVEEEKGRLGGQDDGQGEGEALALGEVAGVDVVRDVREELGDEGAAGAGGRAGVGVG